VTVITLITLINTNCKELVNAKKLTSFDTTQVQQRTSKLNRVAKVWIGDPEASQSAQELNTLTLLPINSNGASHKIQHLFSHALLRKRAQYDIQNLLIPQRLGPAQDVAECGGFQLTCCQGVSRRITMTETDLFDRYCREYEE
jgi:hypothetical protein